MTKYPMQSLGSVLRPTTETITVQPDGIYNVAGILVLVEDFSGGRPSLGRT